MTRVPVRDAPGGARFSVRVAPRASRNAIAGVLGEGEEAALKIALQAPPIEGRANDALIAYLSELLDTPRASIEITAGQHSRNKTILVRGRSAAMIAAVLEGELQKVKPL